MHHKLPKEIVPFRLAQNGLTLEGQLPVSGMQRLQASLHSADGQVDVKMAFGMDEVGAPFMQGIFSTTASVICERCFESMPLYLAVDCLLAMVSNEKQIGSLAEQYEPWLLENNDPVLLTTVVEDELILSLPIVPRHKYDCLPEDAWSSEDTRQNDSELEKPVSPFAVLSALKSKN